MSNRKQMKAQHAAQFRGRWNQIKAIRSAQPRYLHESAAVAMLPNPLDAVTGITNPLVPWVQRPGHTYNVGRNKAKRERRAAALAARSAS